nr:hypothetical protein Iba_chr12bCG20230 [Ipomoea batatas]
MTMPLILIIRISGSLSRMEEAGRGREASVTRKRIKGLFTLSYSTDTRGMNQVIKVSLQPLYDKNTPIGRYQLLF